MMTGRFKIFSAALMATIIFAGAPASARRDRHEPIVIHLQGGETDKSPAKSDTVTSKPAAQPADDDGDGQGKASVPDQTGSVPTDTDKAARPSANSARAPKASLPASSTLPSSGDPNDVTGQILPRFSSGQLDRSNGDSGSARFTGQLVMIGWAAAALLLLQSFFLLSIVRVSRATLVSTLRPKIGIRRVLLGNELGNEPVAVKFTLTNSGSTRAHIVEANGAVQVRTRLGATPYATDTYEGDIDGSPKTLSPGASADVQIFSTDAFNRIRARMGNEPLAVYAIGRIRYADDVGNVRTTAFLRQLNTADMRFRPVGDLEYEYED
jgi:hypothetical protein